MNSVNLIGRLTKNADLKNITNNEKGKDSKVANFTIAVKDRFSDDTDFISIEVWGKNAEFCERNFTKGRLVSVEGVLKINSRKSENGEYKIYTKVRAEKVSVLDKKKDEVFEEVSYEGTPFED